MKTAYGDLNPLVKRAMNNLEEKDQDNNNLVILQTWRELGIREQIGGVAFSFIRHFMENSPPVESISRERRRITNSQIDEVIQDYNINKLGAAPTPFEHRPIDQEITACKNYWNCDPETK